MSNYHLLPFLFAREHGGYLLTNDIGEFQFLQAHLFDELVNHKLSIDSDCYADLESKYFLAPSISEYLKNHYAARYRTKKRFVFESTFLHMIVLTHRCNQDCAYCHASALSESDTAERDLDINTAEKIVDAILSSPTNTLKIEFQGGEPLLNFEVIEHIVDYTHSKNGSNKSIEFVLCSNLTHLTDLHVSFCGNNNINISSSLDGPREIHDTCRKYRDGGGTYDDVINSFEKLRSHDFNCFSALLTVHKDNLHRLRYVVDEYVKLGFNSIFIRALNPYGNASMNAASLAYTGEEFYESYVEVLDYIIEINRSGYNLVEEYTAILMSRILSPFSNGFVDIQSPAGGALCGLMYDTNGNVFFSDEARMLYRMRHNQDFLIGNVKNSSRVDWFSSDKIKRFLECSVLEALPGCAWCVYSPYCGTDPVRNFLNTNRTVSLKTKDDHCQNMKRTLNYLLRKYDTADNFTQRLFWSWAVRN